MSSGIPIIKMLLEMLKDLLKGKGMTRIKKKKENKNEKNDKNTND